MTRVLSSPVSRFALSAGLALVGAVGMAAGAESAERPGRSGVAASTTIGDYTLFPLPPEVAALACRAPYGLTRSGDALWFHLNCYSEVGPQLGRVALDGSLSFSPFNNQNGYLTSIGAGPDNALWWTAFNIDGNPANAVGRFTSAGLVDRLFQGTRVSGHQLHDRLLTGPDGALWYTPTSTGYAGSKSSIGRTTVSGVSADYPIPNLVFPSLQGDFECFPGAMTPGPDGGLWYLESCDNFWSTYPQAYAFGQSVSRVAPDGTFTRHEVRPPSYVYEEMRGLGSIVSGPDGALWMGVNIGTIIGGYQAYDLHSGLARMTTDGAYTEHLMPDAPCVANEGTNLEGTFGQTRSVTNLVVGPDGALWFTESFPTRSLERPSCFTSEPRMVRFDLGTGTFTESVMPFRASPSSMTVGPDGAFWMVMDQTDGLGGHLFGIVRFSSPGLRVVVTSDLATVPATTMITAKVVVTNTSSVTTAPARLTLTEGEGALYAYSGDTDSGVFGTVAGKQNVVYFDMLTFAPGEQKTFYVPIVIAPLIDTTNLKVTADFTVSADGSTGETKTLEVTATPITTVQDTSSFADLLGLPVADVGTNPDAPVGSAPDAVARVINPVYPSDYGDLWKFYVTQSKNKWSPKDKLLYYTLTKKAGFSARSAYAAVYLRSLTDLKPSGSCIPSQSDMAQGSAKFWWGVQRAKWFGTEAPFFSAFQSVASGLGGCSALYPMNLVEFHESYTTPLVNVMNDTLSRFATTYANFELQVCDYLLENKPMTVPLPRIVEADINYRLAKGTYHPILHNQILAQVDIRNGQGGTILLGSAIYNMLDGPGASQCNMVQAKQLRRRWVEIKVHSPLLPVVTDSAGHKSGINASQRVVYDEIPNVVFSPGHPWSMLIPAVTGPLQVLWTSAYPFPFGIDILGLSGGVETSRTSFSGTAGPGYSARQTLDVSVAGDSVMVDASDLVPIGFHTLPPCRLVDTRDAPGPFGSPALVANGDRVFSLFDRCAIPATARALSVNLTVTQPTSAGNLRLYPAGTALPNASAINYTLGQTRANNAVVPLGALGELTAFCAQSSGTTHFILDVNGYYE